MAFGIDDIIGAGLQIANKLIPDPAARAAAALEAEKLKQSGEFKHIEATLLLEQELTKRALADAASDSWLARNIRPLIMIYLLVLVTLMAFGLVSASEFFTGMIKEFTTYGLMFYFGGRTLEKVASTISATLEKRK